jgi:hypothetical protein
MKCGALTKAGTPCRAIRQIVETPDGPRCLVHDPARADQLRAQARLGAQRSAAVRSRPAPTGAAWPLAGAPDTIADAKTLASAAMRAVWEGSMDAKVAHEISVLVNAFVATLKTGELAQRLAEAEALITRLQAQSSKQKEH